MIIGVDLDNTIISCDELFLKVAQEKNLCDRKSLSTKQKIKEHIQQNHNNDMWTKLQGEVYGKRLLEAESYPGVTRFFNRCKEEKVSIYIISHKTKHPPLGPQYNLREMALAWLKKAGILAKPEMNSGQMHIEFHGTRREKVDAIRRIHCDYFIDDLPEVFLEPNFPKSTSRILFDPFAHHSQSPNMQKFASWHDIVDRIFN